MKIHLVFSRNNKIGSRLIAWASRYEGLNLDQYPSHVAMLFGELIVVESTLTTGIRIIPYSHWLKNNEELYKFELDLGSSRAREVLPIAFKNWGKKYDWCGLLFFAWRYLGLMFLDKPLPAKNRWESKSKYFCTEYAASLTGKDYSMKSPAKICSEFIEEAK